MEEPQEFLKSSVAMAADAYGLSPSFAIAARIMRTGTVASVDNRNFMLRHPVLDRK